MNDMCTSATPADAAEKAKIVLERTYRARVDELWELWTTKEGFESWWGPEGFRVEVRTIDARAGGTLHYAMIADAPEQIAAMKRMGQPLSTETRGRFVELEPKARLVLGQMIDFLPGVTPYENTMLVEFFPAGERARMVVTVEPMHDAAFTSMMREGFTSQLTKLDRRFG